VSGVFGFGGGNGRLSWSCAVLCAALLAPAGASASPGVYVTNVATDGAGGVSQYGIGAGDELSPLSPPTATGGDAPFAIAVSPNGQNVYVANNTTEGGITQFDVGAGGVLTPENTTTELSEEGPHGIAVSPNGQSVYVANNMGSGGISQFHVGAGGALTPMTVPTVSDSSSPQDVAVSPNGKYAYVTDYGSGQVSQFDIGSDGSLTAMTVPLVSGGNGPYAIAVSPNGQSVYVANTGSSGTDGVSQYSVGANGSLTPMATPALPAGNQPDAIVVSANGRNVYVSNFFSGISQFGVGAGGALTPLTPATATDTDEPGGIALSPDGAVAYVINRGSSNGQGGLLQFNVGSDGTLTLNAATPTVTTGDSPYGVAVAPGQAPVASFTEGEAPGGTGSVFDGSASSSADSHVVRWDWTFGDGTTASNGGEVVQHTYATPGKYTVTLTVTDAVGCSTVQIFTGHTAACNGGPTATKSQAVTVVPLAPVISAASQTHKTWRDGSKLASGARKERTPVGTTFAFKLNEQAHVTFAFTQRERGRNVKGKCVAQKRKNRRKPSCARVVTVASVLFGGHAGTNKVAFDGRISRSKKLGPGHYTLVIAATNSAGKGSSRKSLSFTIVK
jgi:6-phosphogluconolactonase